MSLLQRTLAAAALGLLSLAAQGQAQDTDVIGGDCAGCTFTKLGPAGGNTGGPNPCSTDVRITIMSFDGSCELANGACEQEAPCFAGVQVEYRSTCPISLDFLAGPNGVMQGTIPLPPTAFGVWQDIIPPWLETLACGSDEYILHLLATDPTGFRAWSTANYWCNACR